MIREVEITELAALADVAQRSYAHAFAHTMTPGQLAEELEQNRSMNYFREILTHDTVLVYVEGERILGYAQIADVAFPELTALPGDQLLDRLYVDPRAQGKGIGRRLLDAALSHPRLAGAKRIFLQVMADNQHALHLYRSAGFEVVGTTKVGAGDIQEAEELIMMRPAAREATSVN